jgi:hypothetical protein
MSGRHSTQTSRRRTSSGLLVTLKYKFAAVIYSFDSINIIDTCLLHQGITTTKETVKLSLAFIAEIKESDKKTFIKHCDDFGIHDFDKKKN